VQRAPVTVSGLGSFSTIATGVTTQTNGSFTYSDTTATNSNNPTFQSPCNQYAYQVAAVDSQGNVGPYQSACGVYLYQWGVSNNSNANYSYGISQQFADTTGNPPQGTYDMLITYPNGGGLQYFSNPPGAPTYALENGAFNYFTVDIKAASTSPEIGVSHISRLPPGDVYPYAGNDPYINIFNYGTFVANQWCTYKVPLSVLTMGFGTFTGSIAWDPTVSQPAAIYDNSNIPNGIATGGLVLTVTSTNSGVPVDAGGFVYGAGLPSGLYIMPYNGGSTSPNQGPGKYNLWSNLSVATMQAISIAAGTTMTYQRTNMYKPDLKVSNNPSFSVFYNNIGWTT
jgi:hypothetical protein